MESTLYNNHYNICIGLNYFLHHWGYVHEWAILNLIKCKQASMAVMFNLYTLATHQYFLRLYTIRLYTVRFYTHSAGNTQCNLNHFMNKVLNYSISHHHIPPPRIGSISHSGFCIQRYGHPKYTDAENTKFGLRSLNSPFSQSVSAK